MKQCFEKYTLYNKPLVSCFFKKKNQTDNELRDIIEYNGL